MHHTHTSYGLGRTRVEPWAAARRRLSSMGGAAPSTASSCAPSSSSSMLGSGCACVLRVRTLKLRHAMAVAPQAPHAALGGSAPPLECVEQPSTGRIVRTEPTFSMRACRARVGHLGRRHARRGVHLARQQVQHEGITPQQHAAAPGRPRAVGWATLEGGWLEPPRQWLGAQWSGLSP